MNVASAWRGWSIAALAAAVVGWWVAPMPDPAPALVKPRQDSWRMAPLPRRIDQTSTAALVSGAGYWGAATALPAGAAAPVPDDPRWRIAAVYGVGRERSALVEFAAVGKAPLRVGVGDRLPSGHRIVTIGEREVCVQIGRKTYRVGVERSGS